MTKQSNTTSTKKPKEAEMKESRMPAGAQKGVYKDRSSHPLASLIPSHDKYGGEQYVSRYFDGHLDLDIMAQAFKEKHNVLLYGPTGSAKTSFVHAFAANNNLPLTNIACNGAAEPRIFVGQWTPQKDKSLDFIPGEAIEICLHGGIIYLDEINFAPAKVLAYIHGWLDKRRTVNIAEAKGSSVDSTIKIHPETMIVAAYNPDYHGTKPMNQALKNRFKYKLPFPYNDEVEAQLVTSSALLEFANGLRRQVESGNLSTPVSTNMLMELEEVVEDIGFDFALSNFVATFTGDEEPIVKEVLTTCAENIYEELVGDGDFNSSGWFQGVKKPKETK